MHGALARIAEVDGMAPASIGQVMAGDLGRMAWTSSLLGVTLPFSAGRAPSIAQLLIFSAAWIRSCSAS